MFPACPITLAATLTPALAFLEGIGAMEMALVAIIGLILFGGKGLPDMARTLGKAMREFKKATSSVENEVRRVMNEEPETKPAPRPRPHASRATQPPAADAPPAADKQPPSA